MPSVTRVALLSEPTGNIKLWAVGMVHDPGLGLCLPLPACRQRASWMLA